MQSKWAKQVGMVAVAVQRVAVRHKEANYSPAKRIPVQQGQTVQHASENQTPK